MEERRKVVIDAGHGGERDPGAVFEGRKEKDDNLRLALAVGEILSDHGVDVRYTRVTDVYDSPVGKAEIANEEAADYFVSIHRNAGREPGRGSGTMTLIFESGGEAEQLARAINRELLRTGFADLGVVERPDLAVLRRTAMTAVLVEAGFLDNPEDNKRFEEQFDVLAAAIAAGILDTIEAAKEAEKDTPENYYYMVQTGVYRMRSLAEQQLEELRRQGFEAFLVYDGYYYRIRVGAFKNLDNAVRMEQQLRAAGFPTVLVYEQEVK